MMPRVSSLHFSIFRMLVAFYLGTYFEVMRHYATRVFGAAGPLANQELNMTDGIFPSLISAATDPQQVLLIFHAGLLLSVLLFFGIARQIVAFVLWVVWASLYNSNNYVADPSTPIVGWLLLFIALVPEGEKFSFFTFSRRKTASNLQLEDDQWQLPPQFLLAAWILYASVYSISGILKLDSESWLSGMAVAISVEQGGGAFLGLRTFLLSLPEEILRALGYGALLAELSAAPLALFARGRAITWWATLLLNLGILFSMNFSGLTLGVLLLHLLLVNPHWISSK